MYVKGMEWCGFREFRKTVEDFRVNSLGEEVKKQEKRGSKAEDVDAPNIT